MISSAPKRAQAASWQRSARAGSRAGRRAIRACGLASLVALASLLLAGCTTFSRNQAAAEYAPSEGILEIVAVLRRHVPDDTYRFPPAVDFTGRNVYRASLLRLENFERTESNAIRSGYLDGVIAFAKARSLERLRAYDLAAQQYREAARFPGELQSVARESAEIVDRIAEALAIGIDLRDPLGSAGLRARTLDAETVRRDLDARLALLDSILATTRETHYRFVVQEEIERTDVVRAVYFSQVRSALEDGSLIALQELQRVVTRHGASKLRLRHILRLADYYVSLAHEYVEAVPPESLNFDPAQFKELSDAAIQLFELVASHDGRPEKLRATRSLEAFLALTLTIDADRFDS